MKRILKLFLFLGFFIGIISCSKLAVWMTPKKQPISSQTALASQAEKQFWQTLRGGKYSDIPTAEKLLTAAYLENPNDPKLGAHLGFLHIWQIAERQRLETLPPQIVDHILLADQYFSDAVELDSDDARYLGFFGVTKLVQGEIFKDKRQQVRGYFILKNAIRKWAQFNYFTAGYALSVLPSDSKLFKQGVEWQWKTLDLCAKNKVDRNNPDYSKFMYLETQQGPERACWNSWIAPYNFEGFFLNMGDMLVKSGDWQTGIKIYQNAKLAKNYTSWPYRKVLEERINSAQENVAIFNKEINLVSGKLPTKTIMFNSRFSCMACHQVR